MPKKKTFSLNLTPDVVQRTKNKAVALGRSLSRHVDMVLDERHPVKGKVASK